MSPKKVTSIGHGADPGFLAVSPQVALVINPVVGCFKVTESLKVGTFLRHSVYTLYCESQSQGTGQLMNHKSTKLVSVPSTNERQCHYSL